MALQNSVQLMGHLGNDPEMVTSQKGTAFATFRIATNESIVDKEGNRTSSTQWHNCLTFGKRAEAICKYTRKGHRLAVQGKLEYSTYTDKNGIERTSTKIIVEDFSFLDKKAS